MDSLLNSKLSLAEALRTRSVVPVLGPEVALVEIDDAGQRRQVLFYDLVAEALLANEGLALPSGGGAWALHRAVAAVMANASRRPSVEALRRSVAAIVNAQAARIVAAPLFERLAALRAFDLFICLTPDDLLVDALRKVYGTDAVKIGVYTPQSDGERPVDLAPAAAGTARVFFPLGRSAEGKRLAIHEEDALEYHYRFQETGERLARNVLGELRRRDLLFLGCSLPDWLGRGFLRLTNENRLSSDEGKMEFFAADSQDVALNAFVSRFVPNATVFPWSPAEFVAELELLCGAGAGAAPAPPAAAAPFVAAPTSSGPTVFISYASEDAAAARRLADTLGQSGFDDVWLDKRKLRAGDDWSDRIDEAIERCDYFMPVLSQQADRQREGVYWEEWRKALARAMRFSDAFVLPVGVDECRPDAIGYERIFNGFSRAFKALHLMHAPGGALADVDLAVLRERCSEFRGARGA